MSAIAMGTHVMTGRGMTASTCRVRHAPRSRRSPLASAALFAALLAAGALGVYGEGWVLREAPVPAPEYAGARCVLDVAYDVAHDVGFEQMPPSVACLASNKEHREETSHE
jgi:hypothetical protein